jgi:undecaprenyl-diphosphatase
LSKVFFPANSIGKGMESIILVLIVTQIVIESIPISSSGHVAIVGLIANKWFNIANAGLPDFLDNILHGTALLSILIVFFNDWFVPVKKLFQVCVQLAFKAKPLSFAQKKLFAVFFKIIALVLVSDIVTSIFYFATRTKFKGPEFLLAGFIITMLLLFSLKLRNTHTNSQDVNRFGIKKPFETLNFKKAVILGAVQGCALLPGISRFASTYVAGCWLNLRPARAFQISFLIHLPLIVAAFLFLGVKDLLFNNAILNNPEVAGLTGTSLIVLLIATVCAVLALKLCYKLAIKNRLWWFGYYMLIPIMILIMIVRS